MDLSQIKIEQLNEQFARFSSIERIKRAYELFGSKLVFTTSAGKTSAIMPFLMRQAGVNVPIIFIDTGYYPPATYAQVEYFIREGFDIRVYSAKMSCTMQESLYGRRWDLGQEAYDKFRAQVKHEPLNRAFTELGAKAWARGIKSFETNKRSSAPFVGLVNGMVQINPILDWSKDQALKFCVEHNLPLNEHHFDITKGLDMKSECKIGEVCGLDED